MCNTPDEINFYFLQVAKDDNFKFELLEHCKGCVTSSSCDTKLGTLEKALAMLKHIEKEINRREKLVIDKLGRKSEDINIHIFNKKFPKEKLPVIQLWVDEAASLYKKTNDKKFDDIIKQAQLIIERVASTGRFLGVYLVNVLQRASKDELPREIKINTLNWISFKQVDAGASKVAIGDETSTIGLPQRVFAFKAATEYVSFAKTPFTRWDTNVSLLEKDNKIREDKQEVFDQVYSIWWSKSIDRNKDSINEAKEKAKGNVIENQALKIINNKNADLMEKVNELEYERDQQAETISELLKKNADMLNMLNEQNKLVGQMVRESASGIPITQEKVDVITHIDNDDKPEIDIAELAKMNYKNADKQRKDVSEEIQKADVSVSPYKKLDLSDIKLNKKN